MAPPSPMPLAPNSVCGDGVYNPLAAESCDDATTTRHALTRLVEWLDSTGEEANLVSRARGRRRIVAAVRLALDEGA